ncbi:hypothetical protein JMG10_35445 [Nostoc ellipsosporum NOK]|nr:hypothetical protein [Nostoc ellipsosporum NOK]
MIRHVHETHIHGIAEEDAEGITLEQGGAGVDQPGFAEDAQVAETEKVQA